MTDEQSTRSKTLIFSGLILLVAPAHFFTKISHAILFWAAYIPMRPPGATLGDILTKPVAHGGLDLSRIASSVVIAAFMIVAILVAGRRSETSGDGRAAA